MNEELVVLKAKRRQQKAALTRIETFIANIDLSNLTKKQIFEIELKFEKLKKINSQFEELQEKIEIILEDSEEERLYREEFENTYFNLMASIKEIMDEVTEGDTMKVRQNCNQVTQVQAQLPLIQLPTFDGNYKNWLQFRDSFNSLVDKNLSLSAIQKFHYLRSCLTPETLETIKCIPITESNYQLAWRIMQERYEKGNVIAIHHVNEILNYPKVFKESSKLVRNLYQTMNNNLEALKNLGAPVEHWDLLLIPIITAKMDINSRREWEKFDVKHSKPTYKDVLGILKDRSDLLEKLEGERTIAISHSQEHKPSSKGKPNYLVHVNVSSIKCHFCNLPHTIYKCPKFLNLTPTQRVTKITDLKLCFNCLKPDHTVKNCQSSNCRVCNKRHNTLLHVTIKEISKDTRNNNDKKVEIAQPDSESISQSTSPNSPLTQSMTSVTTNNQVILPTVIIKILDNNNQIHECRALLDSGAMSNFITKSMLEKLRMKPKRVSYTIGGIGDSVQTTTFMTKVTIQPTNSRKFDIQCLVLERITSNTPPFSVDCKNLNFPDNIQLADPTFDQSKPIDLLLGSSIFWEILDNQKFKIPNSGLTLQKTIFGWVVGGTLQTNSKVTSINKTINFTAISSLKDQVEKFWRLEEVQDEKHSWSPEEIHCEKEFLKTHRRAEDGRFIVKVPFKENVKELGDSRQLALKRFFYLEKRLAKNQKLKEEYINFMREYEKMGHMKIVKNEKENEQLTYYIPHHAVVREESNTTKVRVVFDASMKTTSGLALNEVQYIGPTIQNEIFSTILNFRLNKFVMCADICKMYRMIWLDEEHTTFHRIFWRESPNEQLKCFELQTVTYGTSSAPYLAIRCLRQVGVECEEEYPLVAKTIKNNFYVDDLLCGSDSPEELTKLQVDLSTVLAKAGFELRKWHGNDENIIRRFKLNKDLEHSVLELGKGSCNKVLGIAWNPSDDTIQYTLSKSKEKRVSKRVVLSELAQIFDPLGLLGPIIIRGKIIMQRLWQEQLSWDDEIPQDLLRQWREFRDDINHRNNVKIPRHAIINKKSRIEMHGFADASEAAYGAAVYLRSISNNGGITTRLLCAKSRVAPLKVVSLPRLELCGAVLLARLIHKVRNTIEIKIDREIFWSDSTVALAWIRSQSGRWKSFVANRVSEIQQLSNSSQWYHVISKENPADMLTRGISMSRLAESSLWWNGPAWMAEEPLPIPSVIETPEELPEQRTSQKISIDLISNVNNNCEPLLQVLEKFSNLSKVIRIIAYVLRYIKILKDKVSTRGPLKINELNLSLRKYIWLNQKHYFKKEIKLLRAQEIPERFKTLSPFIDENDLVRVGGRLQNAPLPYNAKHPLLIPYRSPLARMIIEHNHRITLHGGPSILRAVVQNQFWIPKIGNLIKSVIFTCSVCRRFKLKPNPPIMADLPSSRFDQIRPFLRTGVDFAGPFLVKETTRRKSFMFKAYVSVFVCFSTKAVHLEIVNSLSSDSFLAAVDRFVARRGLCSFLHSDNGTNFVGAARKLCEIRDFLEQNSSNIEEKLTSRQIQWVFNPPAAPHFGGLWEAAVKSFKTHFTKMVQNHIFTLEEFLTLTCRIEGILNSRPLCTISNHPLDAETYLTPGHFIIGSALNAVPEIPLVEISINKLTRWQLISQNVQHFWKKWSRSYLQTLMTRKKWNTAQEPLKVGDVVLIRNLNSSPLVWPLARVQEIFPGNDGKCRVVKLKCHGRIITRPVHTLCKITT